MHRDMMPGRRLVNEMVRCATDMFVVHRRCLRDSRAYLTRARDPAVERAKRSPPKMTEADKKSRKVAAAKRKKAMKRSIGPVVALLARQNEANKEAVRVARRAVQEQARRAKKVARRQALARARKQDQQEDQADKARARAHGVEARAKRAKARQDQEAATTAADGRALALPYLHASWASKAGIINYINTKPRVSPQEAVPSAGGKCEATRQGPARICFCVGSV